MTAALRPAPAGPGASWSRRLQNAMKLAAVVVPSNTANRNVPLAVTAETMFTENLAPVTSTTGV